MKKLIALAVLGLTIAACSPDELADQLIENAIENEAGGDVDVEIDSDDGSIEITGTDEDGNDASITFGSGELPDDFPYDLPDGGDVQAVSTSNDGSVVSIVYPSDDFEQIADFFRDIYNSRSSGDENATEFTSSNPPSAAFGFTDSSGLFTSISVSQAGDQTLVSIIYGDS